MVKSEMVGKTLHVIEMTVEIILSPGTTDECMY